MNPQAVFKVDVNSQTVVISACLGDFNMKVALDEKVLQALQDNGIFKYSETFYFF